MNLFGRKNTKLWKKALNAFLVGAALILLIFAIIYFPSISSYVNGIVKAMAAFIYGFVLAFICNPIYKRLHKYVFKFVDIRKPHPRIRNLLSIITTYLIFAIIIAIALRAVVPEIIENWEELKNNVTAYASELYNYAIDILEDVGVEDPYATVNEFLFKILKMLNIADVSKDTPSGEIMSAIINGAVAYVTNIVKGAAGHIFSFIVGFILSFYFLLSKNELIAKIKRALIAFLPENAYKRVSHFAKYTNSTFGKYILGAICDAVLVGCVVTLVLTIFKFPYAALIGLVCGITNVIPFYGPFIGAIPSGLLIFLQTPGDTMDKFWKVFAFAMIILIIQQIDGNIIAPHIQGEATGLSPIMVIAAVTFCSHVFGFIGMLIGVPVVAVISYMLRCLIESKLKKKNLPTSIDCYDVGIDVHNTDFSEVYDENEITREISVPKVKSNDVNEDDDDITTAEIDISELNEVSLGEVKSKEILDVKNGEQTVCVPIKVSKIKKDKSEGEM